MKGSVKLPVFIDDARKLVNTTQLRAKYLGATYEAEYCQWQTLHGLGSLMETASLIITPNAYLEGKLLASYPPDPIGDFDVTRATTATRVNSAGLVELVPYNLLTYSNTFSNSSWIKYGTTVESNSIISPDGTQNASKLNVTAINFCNIYQGGNSNSSKFTSSLYAKKGTKDWLYFIDLNGATAVAWFNLATGTLGNVINGTATIENVGNGWYRCTYSDSNNVSNIAFPFGFVDANNSTLPSSNGYGYIYGAQVVEGTTAKPYQKTETRLNIPRLDYSNGTCPSLLVEPQRTNISQYVESGDGNFNEATVTNATSIVGLKTFKVETNVPLFGDAPSVESNTQYQANTPYTLSFYTDFNQCNDTSIACSFLAFFPVLGYTGIRINKATKAITTFNVGGVWTLNSYEAEQIDGEIYRIKVTATPSLTAVSFSRNYINAETSGTFAAFAGIQLESGSYPTSFINKPTSASVTRNADVISKTGISSLIGQTEGTIFIDANISVRDTTRFLVDMQDGTNNDVFQFVLGGNTLTINIFDSGTLQASLNGGYCLGNKKIALGYKANDFVLYIDGVQVATDTSGSVPTASLIALGYLYIASGYELGDSINASALWKTRLTNTQLAQLTTI